MATSQQFRNTDGATSQLTARQQAARHRNPQPCSSCRHYRQGCQGGYPCERCIQARRSEGCVPGPTRSQSGNGSLSFVQESGQSREPRRRASTRQPPTSVQSPSSTASAIGSPTFMSTHADQNRHDTESSEGQMNSASPSGNTWFGGSFCGSPIGVDLPLQSTAQSLAGSLQDSAVFSLPFADQVATDQQDRRSHAVTSPQEFQKHSFDHSDHQNVQTQATQYTLDYALSFQEDSQTPGLQRGFMQQDASIELNLRAPMGFYGQESPPQTMHTSQYPPTSCHATPLQKTVGEGALVPVQQQFGHFQVVPNDHTQTSPLSPVDCDAMANCDWNGLDVTDEFIDNLIAACDRLGIEIPYCPDHMVQESIPTV